MPPIPGASLPAGVPEIPALVFMVEISVSVGIVEKLGLFPMSRRICCMIVEDSSLNSIR